MKILKAKYILVCDDGFKVLKNSAIAFDTKIKKVGKFKELQAQFKDALVLDFSEDIVMPAFINPHCHLEFSANSTTLVYGDFLKWVKSVITSRSELSKEATDKLIQNAINSMMRSGVATIGEISSFGSDLNACVNSKARVVFYNEILGSNPEFIESCWENFITRFKQSDKFKSELFIPALSIHSTYSTHPTLCKRACDFAKLNNLLLSTHLLESNHENRWLREAKGGFKEWLAKFSKDAKPMYGVEEFIKNFSGLRTLFVHCVYLKELEKLDSNLHSIAHCAVSNRLLSKKTLNLKKVLKSGLNLAIATDGLSSNISLNFFDELRANLLIHDDFDLQKLAKVLLLSSTLNPARALGLNLGSLEEEKLADIAVYKGFEVSDETQIPLQLILQTKEAKELFIGGKKWEF
ncbi:aminofutalosine deaminase family hydrolase [Campylobacter geochelonis]|uniref:Chlorohydrolase n=1 Tax=Campylobacter geochelonis TaxID=1780362 RepID=A0A128EI46_9BACT|nr:metal-dependent hydrolase [Campylobacter geochelonis]QKF70733.1 metallo-dependent hydrolase, subgroup D [Campylobacter geochelonis]CZE48575.1 chlorohydrolase [Campylobacter geochelonis]